nr:MAG TPA: hypothetical protein [Caudoviricetes sp.]
MNTMVFNMEVLSAFSTNERSHLWQTWDIRNVAFIANHIPILPRFSRKSTGGLSAQHQQKRMVFPCAYFLYPKICINHLVQ